MLHRNVVNNTMRVTPHCDGLLAWLEFHLRHITGIRSSASGVSAQDPMDLKHKNQEMSSVAGVLPLGLWRSIYKEMGEPCLDIMSNSCAGVPGRDCKGTLVHQFKRT